MDIQKKLLVLHVLNDFFLYRNGRALILYWARWPREQAVAGISGSFKLFIPRGRAGTLEKALQGNAGSGSSTGYGTGAALKRVRRGGGSPWEERPNTCLFFLIGLRVRRQRHEVASSPSRLRDHS